jgi:hypothetical protein
MMTVLFALESCRRLTVLLVLSHAGYYDCTANSTVMQETMTVLLALQSCKI